ncbi:MAG: hypothetical protein ACP5ID_06845 [Conexivisphaera sp.]
MFATVTAKLRVRIAPSIVDIPSAVSRMMASLVGRYLSQYDLSHLLSVKVESSCPPGRALPNSRLYVLDARAVAVDPNVELDQYFSQMGYIVKFTARMTLWAPQPGDAALGELIHVGNLSSLVKLDAGMTAVLPHGEWRQLFGMPVAPTPAAVLLDAGRGKYIEAARLGSKIPVVIRSVEEEGGELKIIAGLERDVSMCGGIRYCLKERAFVQC